MSYYFYVKMDFSRKDQMVENGAMTDAPSSLTYNFFASRDSVCLDFLISGLNELNIMACEVGNAYLNMPC